MSDMVLHDFWRSSAAYRVRIALAHLGLPYDSHVVDLLAQEQRGPDNLARNPQGLVPTLEIDGHVLTQSLAIIEYLDETQDAGFLPTDALGRARVRALAYAIAMEIHPVCNQRIARYAAEGSGGGITVEGWMQHFIPAGLQAVERMLDHAMTGPFCHGDRLGLADLCLVPQVYNAERWGVDLSTMPRIRAVNAALLAVPAVQAAHPDRWRDEG